MKYLIYEYCIHLSDLEEGIANTISGKNFREGLQQGEELVTKYQINDYMYFITRKLNPDYNAKLIDGIYNITDPYSDEY